MPTDKAKILEIFSSIQGEGLYAGVKQVFVRFFECNMHCGWCDTPHSIGDTTRKYDEMTLEEVLAEIENMWRQCHSVSLTGGEPLMQAGFLKALLPELKKRGMTSYLETNGTLPEELSAVIDDVDIIAMDIKLPSSTKCREYWREHGEFLKIAAKTKVFIKTVVTSDTDSRDVEAACRMVRDVDPAMDFILQPNYFEMKNGVIGRCLDLQAEFGNTLPNIRLLPQIHKFMKMR